MAIDPPAEAPLVGKADWSGVWLRTQRSCVTTLDLARILLFDAIILVLGNGVIYLTAKGVPASDNGFLGVAQKLSHGLFLLLYFILACFHVVEFLKEQRRSH